MTLALLFLVWHELEVLKDRYEFNGGTQGAQYSFIIRHMEQKFL